MFISWRAPGKEKVSALHASFDSSHHTEDIKRYPSGRLILFALFVCATARSEVRCPANIGPAISKRGHPVHMQGIYCVRTSIWRCACVMDSRSDDLQHVADEV
jgi:hypothetical protein